MTVSDEEIDNLAQKIWHGGWSYIPRDRVAISRDILRGYLAPLLARAHQAGVDAGRREAADMLERHFDRLEEHEAYFEAGAVYRRAVEIRARIGQPLGGE